MYYGYGTGPVIRKGQLLVPPATGYNGYGGAWWPKSSRMEQCEEMRDWYAQYLDATEKLKGLKSFLGIRVGPQAKEYKRLQREYERKGKAAWTRCKGETKISEAEVAQEESAGLVSPTTSAFVPSAPPVAFSPSLPASPVYSEAAAGPNYLLLGGLAAGSLLLFSFLRKK